MGRHELPDDVQLLGERLPSSHAVFVAAADGSDGSNRESEPPPKVYRKDYTPPNFVIDFVDLEFDLHDEETTVSLGIAVLGWE